MAIIFTLQQLFDVWGFQPAGSRYCFSSITFSQCYNHLGMLRCDMGA